MLVELEVIYVIIIHKNYLFFMSQKLMTQSSS